MSEEKQSNLWQPRNIADILRGAGAWGALALSLKLWGWTWWALLHFIGGWSYVAWWVVWYSGWVK